jgi:hypothetical protein
VKASGAYEIENSDYKYMKPFPEPKKAPPKITERYLSSIKESDNEYSNTKNKSKPPSVKSEQHHEKRLSILELEDEIDRQK